MHVFIFRFIYLPAITFSHVKFRPSPTYWPTVCPPIYLCVNIHICMYLFLYLYIYLQSPAVILSSDPPQPIDLLSAYLFMYMYLNIYIYMYVFIFIFIYVPAIICSHFKFRPSPTYWPTVCPPIYLCVYIGLSRLLELRKPEYDWGVGWGGMLTFMWTCGSSWCYAHAGWGGWGGMLTFMWTCGSSWCYAHAGWGGGGVGC